MYSGFSHQKWWFSIAMLNYQRKLSCLKCQPLMLKSCSLLLFQNRNICFWDGKSCQSLQFFSIHGKKKNMEISTSWWNAYFPPFSVVNSIYPQLPKNLLPVAPACLCLRRVGGGPASAVPNRSGRRNKARRCHRPLDDDFFVVGYPLVN